MVRIIGFSLLFLVYTAATAMVQSSVDSARVESVKITSVLKS